MRLRHPDGSVVHLSYGSNVHPAESVDGIVEQLRHYGGGVRAALDADLLGVGLWLPATAAHELAVDPAALERVRRVLHLHRLEIVTVNAFPFEGFHDPVVKRAVYRPDWSVRARLDYTLDCARVLAMLLPDDAARGSISTLPLGWRSPWYADRDATAHEHLDQLVDGLASIELEVGRMVRVGLEPEPGCVIGCVADAVDRLAGLDSTASGYLGVCLDTCHLATEFEEGPEAIDRLREAGLTVVKAQASAALHADLPSDPATRTALSGYAEDRFLHQVREVRGARTQHRDDLGMALEGDRPLPGQQPWRVHFHVPLHADPQPPLTSTRDHLLASLGGLVGATEPATDHVEVETYTWGVLPPDLRPRDDAGLITGIAAEVSWVRDRLLDLGLEAA
ncbi:MAG: metabolite traffic protein EboE [Nocardioides sp.]